MSEPTRTRGVRPPLTVRRVVFLGSLVLAGVAMAAGAQELVNRLKELPDPSPDAMRHLSIEQYYTQKAMEATQESLADSVINLLYRDTLLKPIYHDPFQTEVYLSALKQEPRVQKILDAVYNGTDEDRAIVVRTTGEMYQFVADSLPPYIESGQPLKPSLAFPDSGLAYPVILAAADKKAETLPILVYVAHRLQEANRESAGVDEDNKAYRGSMHASLLSYAIGELMQFYVDKEEMRKGLTPRQLEVLGKYSELRAEQVSRPFVRHVFLKLSSGQQELLDIATEFVEAGQAG